MATPEGNVQLGMRPVDNAPDPALEPDPVTPEPEPEPELDPVTLKAERDRLSMLLEVEREKSKFLSEQSKRRNGDEPPKGTITTKRALPKLPADNPFTAFTDPETFGALLDDFLDQKGYVSRESVEALLDTKVSEVGRVGGYYQRNPDLHDPNSAIYRDARAAGEWVAQQPALAALPEAERTVIALQMAEARKQAATPAKPNGDAEKARRTNIARQVGPTKGGKAPEGSASEELTPEQKDTARAWGITEEQYKRHASQGVTMMRKPGGGS